MSLRNRMILFLSIPVILVLVALSVFTYFQASEALDTQIRRSAMFLVENYSQQIQKKLTEKEAVVSTLAKEYGVSMPPEAELRKAVVELTKNTPGVQDLYVGLADKRFIDGTGWVPPADYDPRTRDWYKKALETQGAYYTDVYIDAITKKPVISVAQAIRSGNQVIGVVGVDLALQEVQDIAKSIKSGKTGNAFILNRQGGYVYHETLKFEDNIFKLQNGAFAAPGKDFLSGKPTYQEFIFNNVNKLYFSDPVGKTGWALVVGVPRSELFEPVANMAKWSALMSFLGVLLIITVLFFIARSISNPIKEMATIAQQVATGNLLVQVQQPAGKDEIGILAESFRNMLGNLRTLIRQTSQSAEQVAAASEQLTASAQQSAQTATTVATSITMVAEGSQKQVAAVNETSSIVEEISATMEEVSATAAEMATLSEQAAGAALEGKTSVDRAVTQMGEVNTGARQAQVAAEELKSSSAKIGEIVNLISTIAGQTNLLALNAAIEAARAGEQGRGFAVVAEEVRKLAEQSEVAAQQIKSLIDQNHNSIGNVVGAIDHAIQDISSGVELVNVAGNSFGSINGRVRQVTDQVSLIAKAINEAAVGTQRIVSSIRDVESVSRETANESQNVSAATEEQSASMEEIAASSLALAKLSLDLQNAVSKFRF